MCNAPTHTHVDVPKCSSYDGRHEYITNNNVYHSLFLPVENCSVELSCVHCGFTAKAYYKLIEIIEGK